MTIITLKWKEEEKSMIMNLKAIKLWKLMHKYGIIYSNIVIQIQVLWHDLIFFLQIQILIYLGWQKKCEYKYKYIGFDIEEIEEIQIQKKWVDKKG